MLKPHRPLSLSNMIIPVLFLTDAEQFNKLFEKLALGSIAQCKSVLPTLFFSFLKLQSNHLKMFQNGTENIMLRY